MKRISFCGIIEDGTVIKSHVTANISKTTNMTQWDASYTAHFKEPRMLFVDSHYQKTKAGYCFNGNLIIEAFLSAFLRRNKYKNKGRVAAAPWK